MAAAVRSHLETYLILAVAKLPGCNTELEILSHGPHRHTCVLLGVKNHSMLNDLLGMCHSSATHIQSNIRGKNTRGREPHAAGECRRYPDT
jgi:hypothetical protein